MPPPLTVPVRLAFQPPFLGCHQCAGTQFSDTRKIAGSQLELDMELGAVGTYPCPRSPVDLLLAACSVLDACQLCLTSLRFKPRILASAILLHVGGVAYGVYHMELCACMCVCVCVLVEVQLVMLRCWLTCRRGA